MSTKRHTKHSMLFNGDSDTGATWAVGNTYPKGDYFTVTTYSSEMIQIESSPRNGLTPCRGVVPDEPDKHTPAGSFRKSDVAAAVAEFHTAFDLPQQTQPSINVEESLEKLRISLLEEEVGELITAIHAHDLTGIADALADITYVTYGTALTYGIDLDSVLGEVHRSNMSKLDRSGKPILRADGKVVKSEHYSSPNIAAVLQSQTTRRGNSENLPM